MSADTWVMSHGNEPLGGGGAFFKRVGPRVLAAVVVSAVAAIVVWNIVRLVQGQTTVAQLACVDPTDPCNFSAYQVTNDTNRPVVLRECMHHCGPGDRLLDPITVGPTETTPDSVSAVYALVGARVVGGADRRWTHPRLSGARWPFHQAGRAFGRRVFAGALHALGVEHGAVALIEHGQPTIRFQPWERRSSTFNCSTMGSMCRGPSRRRQELMAPSDSPIGSRRRSLEVPARKRCPVPEESVLGRRGARGV